MIKLILIVIVLILIFVINHNTSKYVNKYMERFRK